jgi:hypothetical protein
VKRVGMFISGECGDVPVIVEIDGAALLASSL